MYSIVLLAALSGSAETATFGRGHGCCGACYGGCHGCYGCALPPGCSRGCAGAAVYTACYGGLFGRSWYRGCSGCHGCYGCYSCCGGVIVTPSTPAVPPAKEGPAPTTATIKVILPEDAALTVDGVPLKSTSGTRLFKTPSLQPGQSYTYTFQAAIVRDGRTITETQHVSFSAGQEKSVSFDFSQASLSASR